MRKWHVDSSLRKYRILETAKHVDSNGRMSAWGNRDIGISVARKEDALLVAAAPEMMEMLVVAKNKIHLMSELAGWDGGSAEAVITQIEDVLKKAKGEE